MTKEPTSLSDEALTTALHEANARVNQLESRIEALRAELDIGREEVGLLTKLFALRHGEDVANTESSGPEGPETPSGDRKANPVVGEAIRELAEAGHPLHISELMDRLRARSVEIPGAGTQANLIAHLTRSDQIVRPKRGMYALASWNLPEAPPLNRATRRRVRGPSKTRK